VTTASEEAASMLETQYTRASELFDAGEVKKAHEILTVLSERDYAPAQAFLGWLCQRGEGVASDATEARRLYEAAAAGGHAVGQCYLGPLDVHEGRHREGFEWVKGVLEGLWWFLRVPWLGARLVREKRRDLMYP
jgi:hypothetical protein